MIVSHHLDEVEKIRKIRQKKKKMEKNYDYFQM